jgi:hypothetical protein
VRSSLLRSLALVALAALACESRSPLRIRPGPVVQEQQRAGLTAEMLDTIAVVPFHPAEQLHGPTSTGPNQAAEAAGADAADLVGRFVSEALAARGYRVVAASDVALAFEAAGVPVPRLDARAAAEVAARSFGATSVLLGRVTRFRELEGSAVGATRPTSVAFEVWLHDAATARRVWSGRFDETQQSLSANVLRARQYPGGGTRWLTAAEFARWGADELAKALAATP